MMFVIRRLVASLLPRTNPHAERSTIRPTNDLSAPPVAVAHEENPTTFTPGVPVISGVHNYLCESISLASEPPGTSLPRVSDPDKIAAAGPAALGS